jgi:hypothetical protein
MGSWGGGGLGGRRKKGHVRWTSSVVGMGVFVEWDVSEVQGRGIIIGKGEVDRENNGSWGYNPKEAKPGGRYQVQSDERQTKVNMSIAAGNEGFRGN